MHGTAATRGLAVAVAIILVLPLTAVGREPGTRGTTAAPDLLPAVSVLDFGNVEIGTTSAGQDVVYTNTSGGDVTVGFSMSGANPGDFALSAETCSGATIPNGGTCTLTVVFKPTAEYARTATLVVTDSQPSEASYPVAGTGVLKASRVAWGTTRAVGGSYTWTQATGLARTVSGSTQYLHAIVQRYDVARWGVYYRRATTGSTWSLGTRINATTQYAERSSIATSGTYVYAAWSSFASSSPKPTQPRAIYFRSNKAHGSGAWGTIKRLTSSTGRIDFPRIAASGTRVYIAYTDSVTGSVKLLVSKDRGVTWRTVTLGSTTRYDSWGKYGSPMVAAYGGIVAVAWISSGSGTVKLRWSSDYGATWKTTSTLGTGAEPGTWPSIAALGTRVAVAWAGEETLFVRVRTGTTWGTTRKVLPSAGGPEYGWIWSGAVALNGTARVGVAWEACKADCGTPDYVADLLWRESANNGATWARSQVVGDATPTLNEFYFPSVLWPTTSTRYVMASRWNDDLERDNVVFRAGTGSP